MKFLGYVYRFVSNFLFLALVYFSLNFLENISKARCRHDPRLFYAAMRAASALHSFYFFARINASRPKRAVWRRRPAMASHGPRNRRSVRSERCAGMAR